MIDERVHLTFSRGTWLVRNKFYVPVAHIGKKVALHKAMVDGQVMYNCKRIAHLSLPAETTVYVSKKLIRIEHSVVYNQSINVI